MSDKFYNLVGNTKEISVEISAKYLCGIPIQNILITENLNLHLIPVCEIGYKVIK